MAIMTDGYPTNITIGDAALTVIGTIETTPPGIDGGDPIDITDMDNDTWRTKAPQSLLESTNGGLLVAYDAAALNTLLSSINVNGDIQFDFPDGSEYEVYGYLKSFVPQASVIGGRPTANIEIVITNQNALTETAPAYTAPA